MIVPGMIAGVNTGGEMKKKRLKGLDFRDIIVCE